MSSSPQTFDSALPGFRANQETPWGQLRYSIATANLLRHLPGRSLRVLDAGGGNGLDALTLAEDGHAVTLLDFSVEMLAEARRNAEERDVVDGITLVQAGLADIPALFPRPEFDLILCHNVLHYLDDPLAALEVLRATLWPDGLLSVIGVNRYSEAYRYALQQRHLEAAVASLDATRMHAGVFGVDVNVRSGAEMARLLEESGFVVVGQYGIRCVCDYIPDNDVKYEPTFFAALEQLEQAMSDTYPYYLLARYFQVVARLDPA